jgi:photosystem II stability/assembly factor-like uncharacterized protein
VLSLVIDPSAPAVLYALLTNASGFFLATSTNGAARWTTAAVPGLGSINPPYQALTTLTPDPQTPGTLYLGTSGGVLKTTDAGAHWNFANSGLRALPIGYLLIDPRGGTLLAAKSMDTPVPPGPALFKSTDGGESWVPADIGLPLHIDFPAADPQDPTHLYILGEHHPNGIGLFQSRDAGESWAEIWTNTNASWSASFAIDPQNPNIMYAGFWPPNTPPRISKSIDGGYTWTDSQFSLTSPGCCSLVAAVAADPQNPDIVYAGTADDGNGFPGGLWKSEDGGVSWVYLVSSNINFITIDPRNPGTIYVNGFNFSLLKSTDGGQTWVNTQYGTCGSNDIVDPAGSLLVIAPQNSDTLYCAGSDNVFRSTDAGASWNLVGSGLVGSVYSLTIDPQNPTRLYAGTTAGLFVLTLDARRSGGVRPAPHGSKRE